MPRVTAQLEALSPRLFLAADLVGTTLQITATPDNDVIIVGLNKRFINLLTVTINDEQVAHYALGSLSQIRIDAGEGSDKIWIDSALDPMAYATSILGGGGDDMITAGAGVDSIDGGDGNDRIYGNASNDIITGGAGRDSIWAGAGDDIITAAAGNDRVNGETGNDSISSDKGNDVVSAGDGNDVVSDSGGINTIDFGAGNDGGASIVGGGTVYGGAGNDAITAVGGAIVFGEEGDDHLQAWYVDGGQGNDTISGLNENDELRGGDGDDLIRGFDGDDVLVGDGGNDALFGGSGTDTLYGGDGADNLYGTNGHTDKHKDLAGHDSGFGQIGADWFETNYRWNQADRNRDDRAIGSQNSLAQDSSAGLYVGGTFTSEMLDMSSSVSAFSGTGMFRAITLANSTSNLTITGTLYGGGNGYVTAPTVTTTSLGRAGWLSSGAYDTTAKAFVPPAMAHSERTKAGRVLLEIPKGWNLGGITTARDDIVWYQVWRDGATPVPASVSGTPLTVNGGTLSISSNASSMLAGRLILVTANSGLVTNGTSTQLTPGTYVWNGTAVVPASSTVTNDALYTVPTLAGGTAEVTLTTPHLYDGVENGAYRYLGVKRGTIIVSGNASIALAPKWTPLDAPLLVVPGGADVRIAGNTRIFRTSTKYDSLPTGGPKLRGIGVDGGAIWLPNDGSEPYFSSGKR
ncbi:MAG: hypothetical protein QOF78_3747 [Phycisphaerales bacterium]|nr:hypothetical protein [Phycisphaerales bacterium]